MADLFGIHHDDPEADLRTALGAIQELHHVVYLEVDDEVRGLNPMCNVCMRAYPCRTRRLADQGLGGGQDG